MAHYIINSLPTTTYMAHYIINSLPTTTYRKSQMAHYIINSLPTGKVYYGVFIILSTNLQFEKLRGVETGYRD